MSSVLVCDVCGKVLEKPFYKLRVIKVEEDKESRDMKTVGAIDMHIECLKVFKEWLKEKKKEEI